MKLSIIQPSRNNLKYLKWSYAAIRKNQGNHTVQICVADDNSNDGTWAWCLERMEDDEHFNAIRNDSGKRLGHTILYDRLVNEVATHDICMIFHADMYLAEGALDAIEKHMITKTYGEKSDDPLTIPDIEITLHTKRIVSLTRVEPPLHPPGPEKIVKDFGTEPEKFLPSEFDSWAERFVKETSGKTTEGVFAPWAFWKKDFQEIGGHDPLYAPQSKEDSDIFNRFHLNGVKFIQVWDGLVYHMTCRGSRFNPTLTEVGTNSDEWNAQNIRSSRNFIRKWGHFVKHDQLMMPIVPHKYDIGMIIVNCNINLLRSLEPWFTKVYVDMDQSSIDEYIASEQRNTSFNLMDRIVRITTDSQNIVQHHDVVAKIDGYSLSEADSNYVQYLPEILADSGVIGEDMGIGTIRMHINDLVPRENELIICKKEVNV